MKKYLLVMRGLPGGGKSTIAERILKKFMNIYNTTVCKCSADSYFTDDQGNYNFDHTKLGKAHGACKWKAATAMRKGVGLVVIDNTNTTRREVKPYLEMAKEHGYLVRQLTVGGTSDGDIITYMERGLHNVPAESMRKMATRLKDSLQKKEIEDVRR